MNHVALLLTLLLSTIIARESVMRDYTYYGEYGTVFVFVVRTDIEPRPRVEVKPTGMFSLDEVQGLSVWLAEVVEEERAYDEQEERR